ncbi:MAG: A/G-specific adenine glycosylase [bacterium]
MRELSKRSSDAARKRLAARLLKWFSRHRRDLPWRRTSDPYHILVSEVMLQQTQVATVAPYYEKFLKRFPTVEALAHADERAVLREWAGLGYYRRARMLHATARVVVQHHGGQVPRDVEALRSLPGVGRYTAGAVASIAFNLCEPVLDGNVMRVLSRLSALKGDPRQGAANKRLWETARALIPKNGARDFNQALMELGALICLPREPKCAQCPIRNLCRANQMGDPTKYPIVAARAAIVHERHVSVLVRQGNRWLIARAKEGQRTVGFWEFPRFVFSNNVAARNENERAIWLRKKFTQRFSLPIASATLGGSVRHQVTHHRITLEVWRCTLSDDRTAVADQRSVAARTRTKSSDHAWVSREELKRYPLSSPQERIMTQFLS